MAGIDYVSYSKCEKGEDNFSRVMRRQCIPRRVMTSRLKPSHPFFEEIPRDQVFKFKKEDPQMSEAQRTLNSVDFYQEVKTIDVRFHQSSQLYTYKTAFQHEEGDEVIVNSPYDGLTIVTVVNVHDACGIDPDSNINYKWVVSKIDSAVYEELTARDEEYRNKIISSKKYNTAVSNIINGMTEDLQKDLLGKSVIEDQMSHLLNEDEMALADMPDDPNKNLDEDSESRPG